MSRIQLLAGQAVNTLEDLLSATESPSVRLGAARTIAEIGVHQHEADAILRKLGEIEAPRNVSGGDDASSEPPRHSVTGSTPGARVRKHRRATLGDSLDEPYDNCPNCGYDLDGHAFKQAIAEAEARDGPDPPPSRVVFYWWPKSLTACPRCGGPLPISQK
jgi:hypothetical protein